MEMQSFADPSRTTLSAPTQAPRAAVWLSEDGPARDLPHAQSPDPRFRGDDYTAETRRDTQRPDSTAEQINIEITR
jgi:hypothetical protein